MKSAADKMDAAYWRRRAIQQAEQQARKDDGLNRKLKAGYDRALNELDKELAAFYARYAVNEGISLAEARKLLRDAELEDFRLSLDVFREKAIEGGYDKELDEIYLRSRISRLQALETQIELRLNVLFQSQRDLLHGHLADTFKDTYYQTVYAVSQQTPVLASFAHIDTETVERLIMRPWLESDFSSRIWADKSKLLRELETTLAQSFVRGEPLQRTSKKLAERMGVSMNRAAALVETESAHAAGQATLRGYAETGVGKYQFEAALDLKTCTVCGAMDGKVFRRAEAMVGVNYNPLHPRCRCTTVPVTGFDVGEKRAARDPVTGKGVYVDGNLSYEEWHKKYVENVPEAVIAEKAYRNRRTDSVEMEKYRAIFGKEVPGSLEAFQELKYNNTDKWEALKARKQEVLNSKSFDELAPLHGKLGNLETRLWYKAHDQRIASLLDRKQPLREQARRAFELRTQFRQQARELMKDSKSREELERMHPHQSFEELLEHKRLKYGLTGDDAYRDIIRSSGTTNPGFDRKAGIE